MDFQERLLWAFFRWQARRRPVTQVTHEELGVLIGKEMGGKRILQPTVSRWFTGSIPSRPTMVALAKVLDVSVGWLAYGEGDPPDDPAHPVFMPKP
jgi:hypothetical protein